MELASEIVAYLNANPVWIVLTGGLFAVALQYLINRYAELAKLTNKVLGLVALPGAVSFIATVGTAFPPKYAPLVAIAGQLIYATYEAVKANARKQVEKEASQQPVSGGF